MYNQEDFLNCDQSQVNERILKKTGRVDLVNSLFPTHLDVIFHLILIAKEKMLPADYRWHSAHFSNTAIAASNCLHAF